MDEWSVLIRADGAPGSDEPTPQTERAILALLPGDDKWFQYPPASGRGHGFEIRFWMNGLDAATTAADAYDVFESIRADVNLHDWGVVRIHVASAEERQAETYSGVDRRLTSDVGSDQWSVMLRAASDGADGEIDETRLHWIRDLLLGNDHDIEGRSDMVETRLWIDASDAVDAGRRAGDSLIAALAGVGLGQWSIVRVWATSLQERAREHFLGVEQRIRDSGRRQIAK